MASTINAKNTSTGVVITPDSSGQLELQTVDTTRMTIDTSGNVGIGTASPSRILDVRQNGPTQTQMGVTNTQSSAFGAITCTSTTFSYGGVGANSAWFYGNGPVAIGNDTNNPIQFVTNGAERMRINSSGQVLFGTTSFRTGESTSIFGTTTHSNTATTTFVPRIQFATNGTDVGFISTDGASTTYSTSSDYRLKENVQPMVGALDTVAQLKPVTYTWKVDGSDGQGFIAHELQEVVPDCVSGEKDAVETYIDEDGVEQTRPVYQGIDTSFLVATLTAAIQEQQAIINDLKARIETLEGASA